MNRGLILREAGSDSWAMLCGAALGIGAWEEPDVAYLADGRLLAATSQGLLATSDGGCEWRALAPFEGVAMGALAQHPSEPNTLIVGIAGSAGSSIQKSLDGAATWSQELALADHEIVTRLLFAPTQPTRVYATVELPGAAGSVPSHALLRSSQADGSWKRFALQLKAEELHARLVAVSPRDPGLLLVLATAADRESQPDRILVSRDGGENFSELWSSMGLRDAGFGADGATVWIAGDTALWQSDAALSQVNPVGMAQLVTCVGAHAGMLYVCGNHSGFDPVHAGVGTSTDGGQTFQRYMAFTEVMKQVACDPSSNTALACQADWLDWRLEILVGLARLPIESVVPDAGLHDAGLPDAGLDDAGIRNDGGQAAPTPDAAPAAPAAVPSPAHARSGCRVSRGKAASSAELLTCALAAIALLGRQRRRARQRHSVR